MEPNIAAWLIAGGPRLENIHADRDREQLVAFRESQRLAPRGPGPVARLARLLWPAPAECEPSCSPA